jgi:3'(2'), 5'-bisphosphate nucleotidase
MTKENLLQVFPDVIRCAIQAGIETLKIYNGDINVSYKSDSSPLTQADLKSHNVIVETLSKYGLPILSEESEIPEYNERTKWELFWIIDPLDGTKEFIKKNGDYTINIGLIENKFPISGVIYVPVHDVLYFSFDGVGAFKVDSAKDVLNEDDSLESIIDKGLKLPQIEDRDEMVVVASKSHLNEATSSYIAKLEVEYEKVVSISRGSSLKLCMVAEGKADVYPRFGPTMEWDIAAGTSIILCSNAKIYDADKQEMLNFNKENLLNPEFIARR